MDLKRLRESTLYLPEELRGTLKHPKGHLFSRKGLGAAEDTCAYIRKHRFHPIIAVGDLVSINLVKVGCQAVLSIMDGKTKRHDVVGYDFVVDVIFRVINPAAQIRPEVWVAIEQALLLGVKGKTTKLLIEGEEDLTALPAVVLAPIHAAVVYGLPDQGIVLIEVTSAQKHEVQAIMQQMIPQ